MLNDEMMPWLVSIIQDGRTDLQRESCWVICNAICGGNPAQIAQVTQTEGVIPAICKLMNANSEPKLQTIILDSLDRCLTVGAARAGEA